MEKHNPMIGVVLLGVASVAVALCIAADPAFRPENDSESTLVLETVTPGEVEDLVFSEDDIRMLAEQGGVCVVMGFHHWREGQPGESETSRFANYHPGTWFRTCRLCEVVESRSLSDWERVP